MDMACNRPVRTYIINEVGLTFFWFFGGLAAVGGTSSSGTVRFLPFVRTEVDRVTREVVPGLGGGWAGVGGGRLDRAGAAALPPRVLPGAGMTHRWNGQMGID